MCLKRTDFAMSADRRCTGLLHIHHWLREGASGERSPIELNCGPKFRTSSPFWPVGKSTPSMLGSSTQSILGSGIDGELRLPEWTVIHLLCSSLPPSFHALAETGNGELRQRKPAAWLCASYVPIHVHRHLNGLQCCVGSSVALRNSALRSVTMLGSRMTDRLIVSADVDAPFVLFGWPRRFSSKSREASYPSWHAEQGPTPPAHECNQ